MDRSELTARLKAAAAELGFSLAGVCPAVPPPGLPRLHDWLAAGYAGEMNYLANRAAAYADPGRVLEGARSILMLALDYRTDEPAPAADGAGRVSRYAWGTDYHDVIHDRLKQLAARLQAWSPGAKARGVVDSAPLLEKEFAQLAGLGWVGKNTLLLNRRHGSWFFLAALLTDLELDYDAPTATDHCGTCTACLDACPTQAFVAPYTLDSRRCISYLTIELRGPIEAELREGLGDWLFGCDICQDVCPWNHRAPVVTTPEFQPRAELHPAKLRELFTWSDEQFRKLLRDTPLWRTRRRGVLRNAAIVLGNQRSAESLSALSLGLTDEEPLVRGASAWALGQIGGDAARELLRGRMGRETDQSVQAEVNDAIRRVD
jgi:epoxyqueuosine reductase